MTPRPITCVYFRVYTDDQEHAKRVNAIPFNSHDQASHWVNTILEHHSHTWNDAENITIQADNATMRITAHDLEDIVEHTPQTGVIINEPDISRLQRLVYFDRTPSPKPEPEFPKPTQRPAPVPPKQKRKPAPTDNTITVAQMADTLNISAGKARNLLRKAKYQKPANGWTFPIDSPEHNAVMSILQQGASS